MPILHENQLDIISHSAEQTRRLGARLGQLLHPSAVLCLSGDMGAGKTVFSSGVGEGWGAKEVLTSPTFNLVHEHTRADDQQRLYHLDCYRIENLKEVHSIGLEDILNSDGVVIIEWAEEIEPILPKERLWVDIFVLEDNRRNFVFEGDGKSYQELIRQFRKITYGI